MFVFSTATPARYGNAKKGAWGGYAGRGYGWKMMKSERDVIIVIDLG